MTVLAGRWMQRLLDDERECVRLALSLREVITSEGSPVWKKRFWFRAREPYFEAFVDHDLHQRVCWVQLTLRGYCLSFFPLTGVVRVERTDETSVEPAAMPRAKLLLESAVPASEALLFEGLVVALCQHAVSPILQEISLRLRLRRRFLDAATAVSRDAAQCAAVM